MILNRVTDSDLHTLADFAELLCLLKQDRVLSVEDLEDHLVDICEEARGSRPIGDAFSQIQWRSVAFGDFYPFSIADNQQSISSPDNFTRRHETYAFLLLCSNLSYVARPYTPLTDAFERLAHRALKRMWPATAEVRTFGKNNAEYQGTKAQRMYRLAQDLGCRPTVDQTKFRVGDSGDGGIDLAAWLELDDFLTEHKFSALAQCACSRDGWSAKQYEINNGKLRNLFNQTTPWLEIMCIPLCFRDNNGRWAIEGDVGDTILIDRLRLLRYLEPTDDWAEIEPPQAFADFLNMRMDLV